MSTNYKQYYIQSDMYPLVPYYLGHKGNEHLLWWVKRSNFILYIEWKIILAKNLLLDIQNLLVYRVRNFLTFTYIESTNSVPGIAMFFSASLFRKVKCRQMQCNLFQNQFYQVTVTYIFDEHFCTFAQTNIDSKLI